ASSRRRGAAGGLVVGASGGLAFCSGGNFRTGSAITLLFLCLFARHGLDGVADVFLDLFQLREQPLRVSRVDAVERGRGQFGAQLGELQQQRSRRLAQIEPVDAAVVFVAAPLDPAVVAELVD